MIEIGIIAMIGFFISLIFDRASKNSKSKFKDKIKMASSSALIIIGWGIVILICIGLFMILVRYILLGDVKGFFS